MKRVIKRLIIVLLSFLALVAGGGWWYMKSVILNEHYMAYGMFWNDRFDASKWFENGMFQHRRQPDGSSHYAVMKRTTLPPIPDSLVQDLRAYIVMALDPADYKRNLRSPRSELLEMMPSVPEFFESAVMNEHYDPRLGMVYISSSFDDRDKPVDTYVIYVLIEGKRFYAGLDLDSVTGDIVRSYRDSLGAAISEEEEDAIFKKLPDLQTINSEKSKKASETSAEEAEEARQAAERVKASQRVPANKPCPRTGYWYTLAKENSRAWFEQGAIMPNFPLSKYGATIWYWDESQDASR